jgi:hypothetical protein
MSLVMIAQKVMWCYISRRIHKNNMDIKHGTTRIVIRFEKFVIKFPNPLTFRGFLYGILSNIEERNKSKKFAQRDFDKYAKCTFCFPMGLFSIMERGNDIDEQMFQHMKALMDVKYNNIPDIKALNLCEFNYHIKLIDYGIEPATKVHFSKIYHIIFQKFKNKK